MKDDLLHENKQNNKQNFTMWKKKDWTSLLHEKYDAVVKNADIILDCFYWKVFCTACRTIQVIWIISCYSRWERSQLQYYASKEIFLPARGCYWEWSKGSWKEVWNNQVCSAAGRGEYDSSVEECKKWLQKKKKSMHFFPSSVAC